MIRLCMSKQDVFAQVVVQLAFAVSFTVELMCHFYFACRKGRVTCECLHVISVLSL